MEQESGFNVCHINIFQNFIYIHISLIYTGGNIQTLRTLLVSISVTSNLAVFWRFWRIATLFCFNYFYCIMYQNIPVINGYPKGKTTRSFTLFSLQCLFYFSFSVNICTVFEGRIQDFKLGGGALKKIAPSGGRREHFWGISCEKSRFCAKKSYFFPILEGVRARCAPLDPPLRLHFLVYNVCFTFLSRWIYVLYL